MFSPAAPSVLPFKSFAVFNVDVVDTMIAPPKCTDESEMPGAIMTNGRPFEWAVASVATVAYEMSYVPESTADASAGVEGFWVISTFSPAFAKKPFSCA